MEEGYGQALSRLADLGPGHLAPHGLTGMKASPMVMDCVSKYTDPTDGTWMIYNVITMACNMCARNHWTPKLTLNLCKRSFLFLCILKHHF